MVEGSRLPLPERILEHLEAHGPDYGSRIAEVLGARGAAVAGALTSLHRRGLVEVHHLEPAGHGCPRKYWCRVDGAVPPPRPARPRAPRAPRPEPPAPPGAISLLDVELALLKAATPAAEVTEVLYGNGPVRGL